MPSRKKTAVIIIHGIGEQRPMDTLWSFIDAAWSNDPEMVDPYQREVYSTPGGTENNHELRRVTTRGDKHSGRSFDFYEYYWAHMMLGNTLGDIRRWLVSLFWRRKGSLPRAYQAYWIAGWTAVLLAIIAYVAWLALAPDLAWFTAVAGLVFPALAAVILGKIVNVAGDAARYLRAEPRNVEARQRIRAEGIALIERLRATERYDRIVMVGHSLGSLVAYDILTHAWAGLDSERLKQQHAKSESLMHALDTLEDAGAALFLHDKQDDRLVPITPAEGLEEKRAHYRDLQREYRRALAGQPDPLWLVSDLVTLGSPLGRANVLLADSEEAFALRKERRELPSDPPEYEYWAKDVKQFSYPRAASHRTPHHAAPFAPVVWSNIYFPARLLFAGDPVAGPCAPHFGPGIRDVELPNDGLRFQHLDYWKEGNAPAEQAAIAALRHALNLRDLSEGERSASTSG
ncbi:hypothetical protein [Erythrobacter rubeus]|uniref:Uncharacterized protein n=1 Tax=Erythrobacter rubeus TaxID=2760803 RepID=A0ABR8KQ15_9SPHN|nr:hypothetical protein [Erythrobacter rubeus]MBD2842784.1 hypothetical protein [Erythrobacter rubeus]